MTQTEFLGSRVVKTSLRAFSGTPPADAPRLKRLFLPQGELAHFYDGQEGVRYLAFIELRRDSVRGNHYHRVKEEQVYIISGEVLLAVKDPVDGLSASVSLHPGDLVLIAPGIPHAMKTVQAGQAIEFSKTPFDALDIQRYPLI